MPYCKNCGAEVPEGQKFCGACGTPIGEIANDTIQYNEPVVNRNNRKLKPCKVCGKMISKNAKRCPNCGKKLKHPFLKFLLFILILILLIVGFLKLMNIDLSSALSSAKKEAAEKVTSKVEEVIKDEVAEKVEDVKNEVAEKTEDIKENMPEEVKEIIKDTTITLDEFNKIESGMTYEQVVEIVGCEGTVMSEVDIGMGDAYKTTIYSWDGKGGFGANANVTIQGGKVVSKAQLGLK